MEIRLQFNLGSMRRGVAMVLAIDNPLLNPGARTNWWCEKVEMSPFFISNIRSFALASHLLKSP
jgi:hypothetical protein